MEPGEQQVSQPDRSYRVWWPRLENADDARISVRIAGWFAILGGTVTAAAATWNLAGMTPALGGFDASAYVDAAAFLIVAFFVFRLSRTAAVMALALYLAERVAMIAQGESPSIPGSIIFTLFYVNGVRGAFAWHRFTRQPAPAASAAQPINPT